MKVNSTILLFIALFSFIRMNSNAQELQASFDKKNILIGEHINLVLKIKDCPPKATIIWPQYTDTLSTSHLEMVQVHPQPENSIEQHYTVTSFDSGYHAVPPFFAVVNGDSLFSNALLLEVHTVEADTTGSIRDIKDIYSEAYSWKDFFLDIWYWMVDHWYIVIPALLLIGFLIYYLVRRSKKSELPPPAPIIPAHIEALEKLKDIEAKQLWQNQLTKEYYIAISETIRYYIERRFEVPALEQTTDEVIHFLRIMDLNEEARRHLVYVLKLADLVKFAKENPAPFENENVMKRANEFITLTSIKPKSNQQENTES